MENVNLAQAVYRLGQIAGNPPACNAALMQKVADAAVAALGVDFVSLAVFEKGLDRPASGVQVSGPWPVEAGHRLAEVTRWDMKDRLIALRLADLERNRMYRRSDLLDEKQFRTSRLYAEVMAPMRLCGEQVVGVFRRADGCDLMISFQQMSESKPLPADFMIRAQAIAQFVAQCWAAAWRPEPIWMRTLKPQSRRVLDDVLGGYDDDQIAERTGLTYHSVRAHLKRLFRDANVRSRLHLMQSLRGERSMDATETFVPGPSPVIATTMKTPALANGVAARRNGLSVAG